MFIARPETIELAIKTAMTALPPECRVEGPTARQWYQHQYKIIDTLEAKLREAKGGA